MRMFTATTLASLFYFAALCQAPSISFLNRNITGLSQPVDMVSSGDGSGRMFIVQQNGLIKIWTGGTTTTNFLNIGAAPAGLNLIATGGEQGLLSMAFHPDYDGVSNLYFYIYYTNTSGDIQISRFETVAGSPTVVNTGSRTDIITILHPGQTNHNGGKLNFGSDGYLYFATGDGGGGGDLLNKAQNGDSLLGKMIRIDVDNPSVTYGNYSVPADNPYITDPAVDDRIYALGLRNPFRWSFDRNNGNIWIGDVGQGAWEEVNFRSAANAALGTNYGWRCYEGNAAYNTSGCLPQSSYTGPAFVYVNGAGSAAVTGGYVYRGPDYLNFVGYYIAADVYSGNVYLAWPNGSGGFNSSVQPGITGIVGFSEEDDGTLYALSLFSNAVYEVVATGGTLLPVELKNFTVTAYENYQLLKWSTALEENTSRFLIQFSDDGIHYKEAGSVVALNAAGGSHYEFRHIYPATATLYYRLKMEDHDGSFSYSDIVKINSNKDLDIRVSHAVNANTLQLSASQPLYSIRLISMNGAVILNRQLNGARTAYINLPVLSSGVYIVEAGMQGSVKREKIFIR